jgi:hypothetical protein
MRKELKSMAKKFPEVGDAIHIYHMFGYSEYNDTEGVVTYIDDIGQIYGTWGDLALVPGDDYEIIEEND